MICTPVSILTHPIHSRCKKHTVHTHPFPFVTHIRVLTAAPLLPPVRIEHSLPVLHLPDLLIAAQIFLDVRRSGRVIDLIPIRLGRSFVMLVLLFLCPPSTALSLLWPAVDELVFFGGRPIG